MHTIMLKNNARKGTDGRTKYTIDVLGDSPVKDAVKESIRNLEHHPALASRRSLIDMLGLIEAHNFRICHAERLVGDDGAETWQFVLQG